MGRCAGAKLSWIWVALLALLTLLTVPACGNDAPTSEAGACVVGQAVVCACDNGTRGAQLCGRDGVYGGCFCMGPAPVDGGAAGKPAGGTGGSSGAAGSGGGKAGSGAGGSSGATGTAGATNAGKGGAGGAAGSGAAGKGGAGGSAGSGGAGAGGAGTMPYSRCNTASLCADGSLCAGVNAGGANEIGYCAPRCESNDEDGGDCPEPGSGDVNAVCIPIANLCLLDECSEDVRCPRGMMCSRVSSGSGSQQWSCVYPR